MFDIVNNSERRERLRSLIEHMQEFMHSNDLSIGFEQLGQEFADEVKSVNLDLKSCSKLLRKGLISHVKQRATECDLLARFNILESLNREEWIESTDVSLHFEELDTTTMSEVNRCFTVSNRIEVHSREIRRLALEHGSLGRRLNEMRKVLELLKAERMGTNEWEADIRTFESERQKEIGTEIDQAVEQLSHASLKRICNELDSKWLNPPSKSLKKQAQQAYRSVAREVSRQQLKLLGEQFNEIQQSGRLESELERYYTKVCSDLKKWGQYEAFADLSIDDDILTNSQQARKYAVEKVNAYETERELSKLLTEIDNSISVGAELGDIEPLVNKAEAAFDRLHTLMEIDVDVSRDYERTLQHFETFEENKQHEMNQRNRRQMAGVVVFVLAAAGITTWLIRWRGMEQELRKKEQQLTVLVDEQRFQETDDFLEALSERNDPLLERPQVRALISTHEQNKSDELARQARVTSAITAIRAQASNADSLDKIQALKSRLTDIENDISFQREQTDYVAAKTEILNKQATIQSDIDARFTERLQTVTTMLQKTRPEDVDALQRVSQQLSALSNAANVSSEMKAPVQPLFDRVMAMIDSEQTRLMKESRLNRITGAVGSADRFPKQLQEFVQTFKGTSRSLSFEEVLKHDIPAWVETMEWNKIASLWTKRDLSELSPQEAEEMLAEVGKIQVDFGNDSRVEVLKTLIPYFQAIKNRTGDESSVREQLLTMIQNPVIQIPYMLETKSGQMFYMKVPPRRTLGRFQFEYFTGLDLSETEFDVFPEGEVITQFKNGQLDWTSPQRQLAEQILESLSSPDDTQWDQVMFGILDRVATDTHLDPLLRIILFDAFATAMQDGSVSMKTVLAPVLQQIADADIATELNYLNPYAVEATIPRSRASKLLSRLPPVETLKEKALAHKRKLIHLDFGPKFVWIGWLDKNESEEWQIHSNRSALPVGAALFTVYGTEGKKNERKRIGLTAPGRLEISSDAPPKVLRQGAAIFMEEPRD